MWKTFAGRCLYQSPEGIRVFQNLLFRWLKFDSKALQTVLNRYAPQIPQLMYIKGLIIPVQLQPDNCCMLGLGGGGVAHALDSILKGAKLDIIENSLSVINVAKRFFMIDRLQNINLIHEEANSFVKNCKVKYQHLLIDLYTADSFPEQCANKDFFISCKKILKPEGILAINLANTKEHFALFQIIQEQFPNATIALAFRETNNLIIYAQNGSTISPFLNALKKNYKIKKLGWTKRWGLVVILKSGLHFSLLGSLTWRMWRNK